ncbi:hypothetical protein SAMN05444392_11050 [Seinonella peptonophila]|uniref:Uncharacterized protein n=1 Tax=Seinonella peptonophila TaxID=112248 RepID=A0A1M4ZQQ7_9BACL|nr:hypothetical protein SAMN05444392_11050 [Seinonella peptonophila]
MDKRVFGTKVDGVCYKNQTGIYAIVLHLVN